MTVSVNPAANLAAGTYTAEIVAKSEAGDQSLAIPVTLVIAPATTPFFDALPGQMSFFMQTKGNAPPAAGAADSRCRFRVYRLDGYGHDLRWRCAWLSICPHKRYESFHSLCQRESNSICRAAA